MKKLQLLIPMLVALFCSVTFSSCEDDYPPFPPGSDEYRYLDRYLVGQWDLAYINDQPVYDYERNFFDFYSDGTGKYYFFEHGKEYFEWIDWYCYEYGNDDPLLHIEYSTGAPLDSYYYFNRDYSMLTMRFKGEHGWVDYVYEYTGGFDSPKRMIQKVLDSGKTNILDSYIRPGSADILPAKK